MARHPLPARLFHLGSVLFGFVFVSSRSRLYGLILLFTIIPPSFSVFLVNPESFSV